MIQISVHQVIPQLTTFETPFKGGLKNSYFELKFISLKHTFSFYDSIPVW